MQTAIQPGADWFRSSDDVRTGYITGNNFENKKVEYSVLNGLALFEGDIVLDNVSAGPAGMEADEIAVRGIAITGQQFRWPRGLVPWQSEPGLRLRVMDAIRHWDLNSQIRFVERTPANQASFPNFISFQALDGCWSMVGMRGNQQVISLAGGCGFGAAVHEIGHAIGLWHEQSREDRDRFIRINWANIEPGREHNFNQHITDGDDIGAYDFGSIMHYPATAFSRNGLPTIVALGGQAIGQRNGLSPIDTAAVRAIYPGLVPKGRQQSGFLIQSVHGFKGNFELVVPRAGGGLAHYWRNNDVAGLPWNGPFSFGSGAVSAASLIQSNFGNGNLEVVARTGGNLVLYWRLGQPPWTWAGPFAIPGGAGATGNPSVIQSMFGGRGNFELVTPRAGGGLAHYWRNNDLPALPWNGPFPFGSGVVDAACLIQSNFGNGNLEVIARQGNQLRFYWRLGQPPWTWNGPFPIPGAVGVTGTPSLVQTNFGTKGNFDMVVPRAGGGLAHFWRNNDSGSLPWSGPTNFGTGNISAVSMIQSNYGNGNLEVIALEGNRLAFYWRLGQPPWTWNGPFYI